jgi:hypothetical protein
MERSNPLRGFDSIRQACIQMLRKNPNPQLILESFFDGLRELDDDLDCYWHPARDPSSNSCLVLFLRGALQSLQWSMAPVSMLRRGVTFFRYLRNVTIALAEIHLEDDHTRFEQVEQLVSKFEDKLAEIDRGMLAVFPISAPYATSIFVQIHSPHYRFLPALDDKVILHFV